MIEKTFVKLMIWDVASLIIMLVLWTIDTENVDNWHINELYPLIRIPLCLDISLFGVLTGITIIRIISIFEDKD